MTFSANCQVNTTVGGSSIETTQQSSVAHNGVTFTFDQAMPVGVFVTGEPFVVSDQGFAITAVSPASVSENGGVKNGAMQDPYLSSDTANEQGFDQFIGSGGSGNIPWNASLNVSDGVSITQGQETTIVKTVRLSSVTAAGEWQTIEKYVPLTVLAAAPPVGCFRPTMSGTTKRLYTTADIDWSVFRSLSLPSGMTRSPADMLNLLPDDPGNYGTAGEPHRRLRLDLEAGLGSGNYSAYSAPEYAEACIILHSSAYSQAQKQDLLYRLITWGIQLEGLYDRGWRGIGSVGGGAGQSHAWQAYYWLTAFVLQSASMLAKCQAVTSPFDNCYWITADNMTVFPDGENSGNKGSAFFEEHIGGAFTAASRDIGPQFSSRYGDISDNALIWEGPAVFLLQNGPDGATGFSARNNGAYGSSNMKSAIWGRLDKLVTLTTVEVNEPVARELWETTCQGLGVYSHWTGPPQGFYPLGVDGYRGFDGDLFASITGGYSWDVSGYDYATETITGREFGFSLDGTQFIADQTVSDNDSKTGLLPGAIHYIYFRRQSASGWGAAPPNYKFLSTGANPPNAFSTGGSGSATTPSFTTNPVIHTKKNPNWGDHPGNWKPVSGVIGKDDIILKAGMGYIDGDAAPSGFTYQWKRDGANISGATGQTYTLTTAEVGTDITCEVTPSNAVGSGTPVTTAAVTVPALTSHPAGTLIATNFRGRFAMDYESELASLAGTSGTASHKPGAMPLVNTRINFGALYLDKTGSNPAFAFDLSEAAAPGTTYDISGQLAVMWASPSADYFVDIEDTSGGTTRYSVQLDGGTQLEPKKEQYSDAGNSVYWGLLDFSGQFTTGANTALTARVRASGTASGGSGADMFLTRLDIAEA